MGGTAPLVTTDSQAIVSTSVEGIVDWRTSHFHRDHLRAEQPLHQDYN